MVINNFNIFGTSFCPSKADAPLPVNTYAVLPGSIALERFQSITGRYSQILEICRNFKLSQFPAGNVATLANRLTRFPLARASVSEHLKDRII
jgi:hypothetical protein